MQARQIGLAFRSLMSLYVTKKQRLLTEVGSCLMSTSGAFSTSKITIVFFASKEDELFCIELTFHFTLSTPLSPAPTSECWVNIRHEYKASGG